MRVFGPDLAGVTTPIMRPLLIGIAMFFNKRAVQVTLVNKPRKAPESSSPETTTTISPESVTLITERVKEVAKFVGLLVVGTYAAIVAVDTVSQIVIKKTKSADNE